MELLTCGTEKKKEKKNEISKLYPIEIRNVFENEIVDHDSWQSFALDGKIWNSIAIWQHCCSIAVVWFDTEDDKCFDVRDNDNIFFGFIRILSPLGQFKRKNIYIVITSRQYFYMIFCCPPQWAEIECIWTRLLVPTCRVHNSILALVVVRGIFIV